MKSETKTVPINNFIKRTNYQAFKLTVYLVPGSNPGDTRAYNDSIVMDVCVGLEGTFTIDPRSAPSLTNCTSFQETYGYIQTPIPKRWCRFPRGRLAGILATCRRT